MNGIVLDKISKSYMTDGGIKGVLSEISHVFSEGSVTFITGPSGCGKTTLLRIIAGLETADSGTVCGVPERISFVFQENRLCEDFSAESNIRLVCSAGQSDKIISALNELGLADSVKKPVRSLSGGMKRRVAIARAVLYDSGLLIMDEPFKGLDIATKECVMDYVRRNIGGRTVICVTHDPSEREFFGGELINLK